MITTKVLLLGELRRWARSREVEITLPEGSTMQKLAESLAAVCGTSFAERALTRKGAFQPHVAVFVDGIHVRRGEEAQYVLRGEKVELMLLHSYEGG